VRQHAVQNHLSCQLYRSSLMLNNSSGSLLQNIHSTNSFAHMLQKGSGIMRHHVITLITHCLTMRCPHATCMRSPFRLKFCICSMQLACCLHTQISLGQYKTNDASLAPSAAAAAPAADSACSCHSRCTQVSQYVLPLSPPGLRGAQLAAHQ
jgi:hypothetical protein